VVLAMVDLLVEKTHARSLSYDLNSEVRDATVQNNKGVRVIASGGSWVLLTTSIVSAAIASGKRTRTSIGSMLEIRPP
jgi:hypothetical protein